MIAPERIQEVAAQLEAALCKEFHAVVVTKEHSLLHLALASGFDEVHGVVAEAREIAALLSFDVPALGLPSGAEYLSDFATTIGTEVALPGSWRAPESAVRRLLVEPHEVTHVEQYERGVDAGWWPKAVSHTVLYLCSIASGDAAEYVGHVEGDAYAVTEAVRAWLSGGTRRPIAEVSDSLRRHYALAGVGVSVAERTLSAHYRTLDDGGVPNVHVCRFTMDWLNAHAADLKGSVPC